MTDNPQSDNKVRDAALSDHLKNGHILQGNGTCESCGLIMEHFSRTKCKNSIKNQRLLNDVTDLKYDAIRMNQRITASNRIDGKEEA